jgi:hypothetical protein
MVNDCFPTGKILPGNKGIAAFSARPRAYVVLSKRLINHNFPEWHGGCNACPVTAAPWERQAVRE